MRGWLTLAQDLAEGGIEWSYVTDVLELTDGNLARAADLAGVTPKRLRELARDHGLERLIRGSSRTSPDEPA